MDPEFTQAWVQATGRVLERLTAHDAAQAKVAGFIGVPSRTRPEHALRIPQISIECFGLGLTSWSPEVTRIAVRKWRVRPRAGDCVTFSDAARPGMLALVATRVGYAAAFGDASVLRAGEASHARAAAIDVAKGNDEGTPVGDAARRLLSVLAPGWIPSSPPDDGAASPIEPYRFRHGWIRHSRGFSVPTVSEGLGRMRQVDPEEAPEACRLVAHTGEVIVLRVHEGRFLRPVLRPGSWEPADGPTFRSAVALGVPWADNPYVASRPAVPLLALDECALPEPPRLDPQHAAQRAKAQADVEEAVGTLLLIDGVVHRTCPPPVAHLVRERSGREPFGILTSWSIPGHLAASDDMSPLGTVAPRFCPLGFEEGWESGRVAPRWPAPWTCVPLGDADQLAGIVGPLLRGKVRWGDGDLPFEVLRPDLVGPDLDGAVAAVQTVAAAFPKEVRDREAMVLLTTAAAVARHDLARGSAPGELPTFPRIPSGLPDRLDLLLGRLCARVTDVAKLHEDDEPDLATFRP